MDGLHKALQSAYTEGLGMRTNRDWWLQLVGEWDLPAHSGATLWWTEGTGMQVGSQIC